MNPELLRNLWLEFSIRRLIGMPLVLALIFAAPPIREERGAGPETQYVTLFQSPFADEDTSIVVPKASPMNQLAPVLARPFSRISFGIAIGFLLFLWGTRLAADSLFAEVNGRTWDSQRASAIGPWAMTIGKLFGSTAYVWYGAFFCLIFWADRRFFTLPTVLSTVIAGLWAQALALFTAFLLLRMAPERSRYRVSLAQATVLVVGVVLLIVFNSSSGASGWYGLGIPNRWFAPAGLLLATLWSIVGIYQLTRAELQLPSGPGAWIGFLITLGVFAGGFGAGHGVMVSLLPRSEAAAKLVRELLTAAVALSVMSLTSALLTPPRLLALRQWLARGPWPAGIGAPSWLWAVGIAVLSIFAALALAATGGGSTILAGMLNGPALPAATVVLLFAVRDIGILHALALNPGSRRGLMATIVVIAISYLALPELASALHADDLVFLFRPDFLTLPALALGGPAIEALIAWLFAARIYRRLGGPVAAAILLATLASAPAARAAGLGDEPCPRTSAHEMLLEAGLVFEGELLTQDSVTDCAAIAAMCGQQSYSFRIDRVLKGDLGGETNVRALRISSNLRPLTSADPKLAVPQSGLYVLVGNGNGIPGLPIGKNYFIDECLLGLPLGFEAEADAYAAQTGTLTSASDAAPGDPAAVAALTDHYLRHRDPAATMALQHAIIAFPANQAIHAQYLYALNAPTMLMSNPAIWNAIVRGLSPGIIAALETPTAADPESPWVQRLAMMAGKHPATDKALRGFSDFSSFSYQSLQFAGASLRGAKFVDTRLQGGSFRAADLSGADLRWSEFDGVDLSFAQLSGADLSDWNPATRNGVQLRRRLRRTQSAMAAMLVTYAAEMSSLDAMSFATGSVSLLRATLDRANLTRATLIEADLRQASFRDAVLKDADLREADLRVADFTGADLSGTRLEGASSDCSTRWPAGFSPRERPAPSPSVLFCQENILFDSH